MPYRTDIPADKYEGCREGRYDPKLANYVNNSIKEINVKRDYFSSTTFCFCFLDHRCNGSSTLSHSMILLISAPLIIFLSFLRRHWKTFRLSRIVLLYIPSSYVGVALKRRRRKFSFVILCSCSPVALARSNIRGNQLIDWHLLRTTPLYFSRIFSWISRFCTRTFLE